MYECWMLNIFEIFSLCYRTMLIKREHSLKLVKIQQINIPLNQIKLPAVQPSGTHFRTWEKYSQESWIMDTEKTWESHQESNVKGKWSHLLQCKETNCESSAQQMRLAFLQVDVSATCSVRQRTKGMTRKRRQDDLKTIANELFLNSRKQ